MTFEPKLSSQVSIVVVNYNGERNIDNCLESVLSGIECDAELLVVDNASQDSSCQKLTEIAEKNKRVRVVFSPKNLGYAGAINYALKYVSGKYLAVLNMDLLVEKSWLQPLVNFLDDNPDVAAVTPLVVLMDRNLVNAAGQNIHITGLGFNRGLGESIDAFGEKPFAVSGLHGCAFVTRTQLLKDIGGFDEAGFLYHEDVNMSWFLRLLGFELYCVPGSVVYHDYFLSMYPAKFYLLERNRIAMLFTYLKYSTLMLILPFVILTEIMSWGFSFLRGAPFLKAKIKSYLWVVRHRLLIGRRRSWAQQKRKVSDWKVLSSLRLQYDWSQFKVLGREGGKALREPKDGLTVK
nr:glycosyltransferase family 2 protein [Desulfobulbaceae bacterium]